MIETASWSESWRVHRVVPIYKKKALFAAGNYRGTHVTAQLSKVAERLLLPLIEPHISRAVAFGPNQFACTKGRGARDALAFLMMSWLLALNGRMKVAVYCSDVSGAFDRVRAERLLEKLRSKGVHPTMVALAGSWLQQRTARVVVDGQRSDNMLLKNMFFLRAPCWAPPSGTSSTRMPGAQSMRQASLEIVYADDLNGFKEFEHNASVDSVMAEAAKKCQSELQNQSEIGLVRPSEGVRAHRVPQPSRTRLL